VINTQLKQVIQS
jgi:dynein heavy chain, axonemal